MIYDLVLTGGKTIQITEDQKQKIESYMSDSGNGSVTCLLGKNTIRISMVKGIFEGKNQQLHPFTQKIAHDHHAWNTACEKMALLSIQEKVEHELQIRISPLIRHTRVPDYRLRVLHQTIESFFIAHSEYPRCPSTLWWPVIMEFVDPIKHGLFMTYVIRNDYAIESYVELHKK